MMLDSNHGRRLNSLHFWMFKHIQFGILLLNMFQRQLLHTMEKITLKKKDISCMGHISFWMSKGQKIEEKLFHLYNYLLR